MITEADQRSSDAVVIGGDALKISEGCRFITTLRKFSQWRRWIEDVVWNDISNKSVEIAVTELGEHLLLVLLARAEMALQEWRGQSDRNRMRRS